MKCKIIGRHPERTSKVEPYIGQYVWIEINFLTGSKDWNTFEKSNKTIAHSVLFLPSNGGQEKLREVYIFKHSLESEHQVILVMIIDAAMWHYLAVTSLSRFLHEIM